MEGSQLALPQIGSVTFLSRMAWHGWVWEKLFLYYYSSAMLLMSIEGSTEIFNLTQPKIYHLKLDLDPFISSNDHIYLI